MQPLLTAPGRDVLCWTALLVVVLVAGACQRGASPGRAAERPPNIVFIVADDLGYGDLGSYGQEHIQTPHLDRMAREGMHFTQFYAGSTVCAPSRSVLMTGQHTGRTPIRGNREMEPLGQAPLPDSSVTVAELLQEAGYATGAFGKWGLGGPDTEGVPTRQGFDTFFGYLDQARAHFYYPEFLFRSAGDSTWRVPLEGNEVIPDEFSGPGAGQPVRRGVYSHDRVMEEALSFVRDHREEPFFLYLPVAIPHASLTVPDEALAPYLDDEGQSIFPEEPFPGDHYSAQPMPNAAYAAMVTHMDRGVGRLLDTLRTLGLDENTIVFFTSDNGPHAEGGYDPQHLDSNGPLRGGKRDLYEGGIRVPMIAWGPGRIRAGQVSERVGAFWDVLPTLADLADRSAPPAVDGISLASTLLEAAEPSSRSPLYWEFYEGASAQAVRDERWKAVRRPAFRGTTELYDLQADPGEAHDVAADHPDVVERLEAFMEEAHTPSPEWTVP